MRKTVNEAKTAYTYYLEEKMNKIFGMVKNDKVSLEDMKRNIRNYIWNASYSYEDNGKTVYTKKKWFIETMNSMDNKSDLFFFCRNSVNKAKQTYTTR